MKMAVSAQSLGSLAPYVVSAAMVFPAMGSTVRAGTENLPEAYVFVDVGYHQWQHPGPEGVKTYSWDPARPELTPYSFVHITREDAFGTYEPFIASEGLYDVSILEGPFKVEEESRPSAFLDEYDLSTIALYGEQQ